MIVDLHTHTNASDGSLNATELLQQATAAGVELLSITDHDTLDAYATLPARDPKAPQLIGGIELSTEWRGCGIHVLGLNVGLSSDAMRAATTFQCHARAQRAEKIAERLEQIGVERALAGARTYANGGQIGRPHFARHLVASGFVKDFGQAFRKFLGAGKIGDVKQHWAPLERIVGWIRDSGGTAVLAHPGRYGLTHTRRNALITDFAATGGTGLEIISGRQEPSLTATLATTAGKLGLLASCGSDFHHPGQPWARIGMPVTLPSDCRPVWETW
ncbi:MAG: PHP domain-containing protein [Gammaproteobacteria bacterium]|jgi:predicted metal-dependent phosphoesterase TrpH